MVSAWQLFAWQVSAASKPCASSSNCTRPLSTMRDSICNGALSPCLHWLPLVTQSCSSCAEQR